jgi:hypothetical protein
MSFDFRTGTQLVFDFAREAAVESLPTVAAPSASGAPKVRRRRRSLAALRASAPIIADAPRPPRGIDHERPSQQRFDAIVLEMLARHPLRVKRWRNTLSGIAVLRIYRDGRQDRSIEAPYPTSALRLAIFLHEVGHHVLGLGVHRPRCLEEYLAWRFALDRLAEFGVETEGPVARRFDRSMRYAVAKAVRRGIRRIPAELATFLP